MIVDVDGGAGAECGGVPRYEELLASADPVPSTGDVDDGDPAMLLYTSGTDRGCRAACCFRMARF